jgi:acyl dehydratase
MTLAMFTTSIEDRFYEDYVPGAVHRFGSIAVEEDEVIAFARRFDPQPFHVDREAARSGPFGGLIASGWHTAGLMMRLMDDHFVSKTASLGSPGVDQLRWLKPVRPGDQLSVQVTIISAAPSRSRPDRGAITISVEVFNQIEEAVMSMTAVMLIKRRPL